jgi:hypothetical protein
MTDNRIHVDLTDIDERNHPAVMRQCWLALMNAGGLDGDWWEIEGELAIRPFAEVLTEYFKFWPRDDSGKD